MIAKSGSIVGKRFPCSVQGGIVHARMTKARQSFIGGEVQLPLRALCMICNLRRSVPEVGIESSPAIATKNSLPANGFGTVGTSLHLLAEHALETRHAVLNSKDQQDNYANV